jgi:hypothetical protein
MVHPWKAFQGVLLLTGLLAMASRLGATDLGETEKDAVPSACPAKIASSDAADGSPMHQVNERTARAPINLSKVLVLAGEKPGIGSEIWDTHLVRNAEDKASDDLLIREGLLGTQWTREARNQYLHRVAVDYIELLRLKGLRALALATRHDEARVAAYIQEYSKTESGHQIELDKALTEKSSWEKSIQEIDANFDAASKRLALLLGLQNSAGLGPKDELEDYIPDQRLLAPLTLSIADALERRPEVLRARSTVLQAIWAIVAAHFPLFHSGEVISQPAADGADVRVVLQRDGVIGRPGKNTPSALEILDLALSRYLAEIGLLNPDTLREGWERLRVDNLNAAKVSLQVAVEVTKAHTGIEHRFARISICRQAFAAGSRALEEDLHPTTGRPGTPAEVLASLHLVIQCRLAYLHAVAEYQAAEFDLALASGLISETSIPSPSRLNAPHILHLPDQPTPR